MAKQNIIGPGYLGRSANVNASRCVNLYPEINSQDSKAITSLVGTPGSSLYVDTLISNIRGMHYFNNLVYFVAGNKLFSVNSAKQVSQIIDSATGLQVTLATSIGPVSMADNGIYSVGGAVANQLVFVDGINTHCVNVSTLVSVSFSYPANTVCFIGSYFVIDISGAQWRVSNSYDGTTWPGLYISTADASPDNLMSVVNNHNELWLIGEYTSEIWYQSGTGNPPFARQSGGVLDYGTSAPHSVAKGGNTLFWLVNQRNGEIGTFVGVGMVSGYSVSIISPQAINDQISRYAIISDAFGYCYADKGHEFYVLTFPTANATWVYDITTQLWHERSLYTSGPYIIGRHIGNCYAYAWGKHLIGDFATGKIFEMSEAYYTDNGLPIASIRTGSPIEDESNNYNIYINRLQLDMETGVGLSETSTPYYESVLTPTIDLGGELVFGTRYMWVVSYQSPLKRIIKLDNVTGEIVSYITLPHAPYSGVCYFGYLWVFTSNRLYKIDIDTDVIVEEITISLIVFPKSIVCLNDDIYFNNIGNRIYKYNITTGTLTLLCYAGGIQGKMVFGGGYLWVCSNLVSHLYKVNINTGVVLADIILNIADFDGLAVTYAGGYVWVILSGLGLVKVDPVTNTVLSTYAYGLVDMSFDMNYLYGLSNSHTSVLRLNFSDGSLVDTLTTLYSNLLYCNDFINLWNVSMIGATLNKTQLYREAPNNNPVVNLSWSSDGGHTWSNDHSASIGRQGEYGLRVQWHRLGKSRNRIFRFMLFGAVKKVLMSTYIEAERGSS